MANCIGVGCKRQSKARNLCMKHLMRLRKHGDIERVDKATTHGKTNTPEYFAWLAIKQRCYNKKIKSYKHYGAKGVSVCDRWMRSFENFYSDMGERPSDKHSLDRIDPYGNYDPSNCRWATLDIQMFNKRSMGRVDHRGVHKRGDKYVAQIKGTHIGTFTNKIVAAWMYDQWAVNIYGDDISTNLDYYINDTATR